ncbi:DNA-directed RNA polymerase [Phyllobacterium endophyticum]|uniref:DNA-directed RNA polymerase n=1 Tax=Phyllobacterium endophyticum TaxID=1149773 RepID=UPI0011C890D8|nr:DNA-directed RNA polymerase [Phyllobacterium endophyticum]TXR49915.1 hypothetical protein FVA77_07835 [Phyllobacterium endophyticum]
MTIHTVPETVTNLYETGIQFLNELQTDPALKAQFELEDNMKAEGVARYERNRLKAEQEGTEGDLVPQQDLIRENVLRVAAGITAYLDFDKERIASAVGRGGRKPGLPTKWLSKLSPTVCAFIGLKTVFNGMAKERSTAPLALAIGRGIEEEIIVSNFAESEPKLYQAIVQAFTSRSSIHHRRVLKAAIARHRPDLLDVDGMTSNQTQQEATGLLILQEIITKTGLFEEHDVPDGKKVTNVIKLSALALEYIEKRHEIVKFFVPVWKPCIIEPRKWSDLRNGGYHGTLSGKHPVVKGRMHDRQYVSTLRKADMSLVYEGLNALQGTRWAVNKPIFDLMDAVAGRTTLGGLPDVDKEEPREPLNLPENRDDWTASDLSHFREWKAYNAQVHKDNFEKEQDVSVIAQAMETARQFRDVDQFYFPWNFDSRGRAYPIARGLQPQGSDWQKALLQFAVGREYDEVARYYLAFHGANCKGEIETGVKLDKALYETRVQWVIDNTETIARIADEPLEYAHLWEDAESPWMFLAFCMEWTRCERARAAGLPAVTHLAPAFDGSCNGLQHFSAALRDEVGGQAVNLVANQKPSDIYSIVKDKLVHNLIIISQKVEDELVVSIDEETGEERTKLGDAAMARRWLASNMINRTLCKQPVMTMPYGSNRRGIQGQMMNVLKKAKFKFPKLEWQEKASDGFAECTWLAGQIWVAIGSTVVKAREAMDWLQKAARVANKANIGIEWTAPSGLPVKQFYEDRSSLRIKTQFMGQTFMPRMQDVSAVPTLSKHEQVNGISPNFVHSLDASAMLLTVVQLSRKGVKDFFMVHDSFAVPAADSQLLWDDLRAVFVDMYEMHDVLSDFRERLVSSLPDELVEEVPVLPAKGELDLEQIMQSDYFFA